MDNKDLKVGQIIIGKPTGNNARYNKECKEFEVVKIKRKYVDLRTGFGYGAGHVESYSIKNGSTQSMITSGYGGNAGYRFFKSMEAYQEYEQKSSRASFISDKLRYSNTVMKLPISLINEIYLALKKESKES